MDIRIDDITTDILFTDDEKINAEHILQSYVGEFKQYPDLGLGHNVFVNAKEGVVDQNLVELALDQDNLSAEDITLEA